MTHITAAFCYQTPFFTLSVTATEQALTGVTFIAFSQKTAQTENAITRAAFTEIMEYLDKKRQAFDIPVLLRGTEFQMRIWRELQKIPYGKTLSYGAVARAAGGNAKAARAAGRAIHVNPIAIIVPCHRVIGADGSLTGFAGGRAVKKKLLEIEGAYTYTGDNVL
ncbi:MAG: methylated-DNA--[protein]-cysteine S-methyltransferase [Spirochaetaceae bacterium]|jgi:methylated-DNA-[protein]-cysteine S-methyltransferase|nr:methylated-DNA--[protein]-cysteine S-methyltransferase [Spirochaetaceae bacterium]